MHKRMTTFLLVCLLIVALSAFLTSCSTDKTPDEPQGFAVSFVVDEHVSVFVYPNGLFNDEQGQKVLKAYAINKDTGEIDLEGSGQVNFKLVFDDGYTIDTIEATPTENYKNLKGKDDTNVEYGYRLTKITGDVTVQITSKEVPMVTVRFDTGADDCSVENQRFAVGCTATRPSVVRNGFMLRRWMLGDAEFDFSQEITEDTTLTAEWLERSNLPTLSIELKNDNNEEYSIDLVDRETYVSSEISIVNADGSYEVNGVGGSFKGRGNGSWREVKKGYKLKFDKKQSLFGRTANKHWVILACTNFQDSTMLRNFTAYTLAGQLFDNLEYVTNTVWIDVYVNGEYRGVYVLCEHVRVGNGRVNVKSEYGVEDTGYLVEYDYYATGTEGINYFSINDDDANKIVKYNFTMHSPDPEDYATDGRISEEQYRAQVSYIQDYVKRVYKTAIVDHDFATLCELVDVDSLVDMYILHELYKNTDTGYSSFYMYKKPGGKLYFGPPWDFDATTTSARGEENNPEGIYVAQTVHTATRSELFVELYKAVEFKALVVERWNALSSDIAAYYNELFTDEFYAANKTALGKNFVRWSNDESLTQEQAEENWVNACITLKTWFLDRIAFLNNEWHQ